MTTVGDRAEVGGSEAVPSDDVSLLVRGVSPVLEVPFTPDGSIDAEGFRRVVRYVLSTGVTSMMFPGFASEFHKLSEDER
jgi:dihydrodipicolinate synthase/N-acetylneuraminate lyase